ncbi:ATP-binding protein [Kitasatospora cineracea]|uniref:Serine/threonine-protein kinase RsbW n=1 Tax=Kitasatospora cineracea TaxID=88074 RepID=A0A3N4RRC8_9ACTN|nr:ATP-binding protein [Kitasatospora cineracea]RPE33451.1 serine/threonine-protein kinase RsbW [Kitasatospora cineracea]
MDIWWTLHLKRDPASVPLARRILLGAMDSAGVDPQVAFDLGLALTEACANAVEHAAPAHPGDTFQVTASLSGDLLRIEVANTSPAAAPALAPAPAERPAAAATAATERPAPRPAAPRRPAADRPAARCRTRRGRASVPARVLTARRPAAPDRPAPYDTHVLPPLRPALPAPAADTLPDLDAECGRGLFLIHALADRVQLRTHPLRGATVSFDKVLTPGPAAAALLRTAS